ncbi:MAG TPA: HAD family hydrolase [Gemmatimonadales bacterium]|nr:HAD family hydrolase [Gemmatimonadales bacterium]
MPEPGRRRSAAFLDRDGTLIEDPGFLSDPAKLKLLPGAAQAVRRLNQGGLAVVIVTNQSGIARGLITAQQYDAVHARLVQLLAGAGARLDGAYVCPHHPDISGPCECRKPGTKLFRDAATELTLDLGRSFYVGDRMSDVEPARALGGRGILVRTGRGGEYAEGAINAGYTVVADLQTAVDLILEHQ